MFSIASKKCPIKLVFLNKEMFVILNYITLYDDDNMFYLPYNETVIHTNTD